MDRRFLLKFAALAGVSQLGWKAAPAEENAGPIVLYCDLAVDSKREQEMLSHFHRDFKPAAEKFDGYIDVKMVKFRKVIQGQPALPPGINSRFQLTFKSEELRQRWISSSVHQAKWPLIENTLLNKDFLVVLTDVV